MEYPWHKPESPLGVRKRVPNKGIVAVSESESDLEHWNSVQQTLGVYKLPRKTLFFPSALLLMATTMAQYCHPSSQLPGNTRLR